MTGPEAVATLAALAALALIAGAREVAAFLGLAAALVAVVVALDARRVRDSRRRNRR